MRRIGFGSPLAFWKAALLVSTLIWAGCQKSHQHFVVDGQGSIVPIDSLSGDHGHEHDHANEHDADDGGIEVPGLVVPFGCKKASKEQMEMIDQGNAKFDQFMQACLAETDHSSWCEQLTRPNPASRKVFICTYGSDRPHRLIHPDESTWTYAFDAIKLIRDLEQKQISVLQIYNWWRPEPYNDNVGGAAGRHPFGTSVDVRFSSTLHMENAHKKLCEFRKKGRLRALGYYGSTGIHIGVADHRANTWGKSCP